MEEKKLFTEADVGEFIDGNTLVLLGILPEEFWCDKLDKQENNGVYKIVGIIPADEVQLKVRF